MKRDKEKKKIEICTSEATNLYFTYFPSYYSPIHASGHTHIKLLKYRTRSSTFMIKETLPILLIPALPS